MGAGDVPEGIDSCQDDEREAQRDADMRHGAMSVQVDRGCAGADYHQHAGADGFGQETRALQHILNGTIMALKLHQEELMQ